MEAVTIGPIPKEINEPNFAPNIIDKYSNCANAFCPNPNKGTTPNIKNKTRTISVHFIFDELKSKNPAVQNAYSKDWWRLMYIDQIAHFWQLLIVMILK